MITISLPSRLSLLALLMTVGTAGAGEPISIGDRRELFVDRHFVGSISSGAELRLQQPTPHEVILVTDKPWEGNTCAYYTIFQDGDRYRMYYRGSHYDTQTRQSAHREVTCYAESKDGIHWTKPNLGLYEFDGSKNNNIVWDGIGTHDFTPFKDTNPDCPANARYKAFGRGHPRGKRGLYAFQSPDGIHWKLMKKEPVITKGAFDSQNLAFWDEQSKTYREYHRGFRDGVRDIMTSTSADFLDWSEPVFLTYPGAPKEHLYTNAIRRYERAPHLFIGFPTRYQPQRHSQVEPIFMSSRDGVTFHRWADPVIPVTAPKDRDTNRSNYMTWGLVQLPNKPREYTVYATEAYYTGPDSRVRRFSFRLDGFTSLSADEQPGELITKPLRVSGNQLRLNYRARKEGELRLELQDQSGKPLPGLELAKCVPLKGDEIEQSVSWEGVKSLTHVTKEPIRIRFVLKNADVFSFRFTE